MTAHIHVLLGTKAQLIKMGPIMRSLAAQGIEYRFIHSGQHQETISDLIANFDIKSPDIFLHKGKDITGIIQMLFWAIKILLTGLFNREWLWGTREKGYVLVHGDTFSTLLGALLAKMHGHKTVHVESGLRSFNIFHPFPEELTRIITMRLADIAFAPGAWAASNLEKYGCTVIDTHENTLLDSTRLHLNASKNHSIQPSYKYGLVSIHRFENIFDEKRLAWIVDRLIISSKETPLLFILHNPTRIKLEEFGLLKHITNCPTIEVRPRYDHIDFLYLVDKAEFVITDGGSNQEECHYLGKPCLIMRAHTERLEGLDGNAVLSRFDEQVIANFIASFHHLERPSLLQDSFSPSELIARTMKDYITDKAR